MQNHDCIKPYVTNVERRAMQNRKFRDMIWTGCNSQMTVMCIAPRGEIGLEIHEEEDQIIRIEQGCAIVQMGLCKHELDMKARMTKGDTVFIPAGYWHNIINVGCMPLRVSAVYAPPHHDPKNYEEEE